MNDALYIRQIWTFSKALDLALVDEEVEKGFKMTIGQRHGERVGYIALRIGMSLGFNKQDLIQLVVAGLMHDIGTGGGFAAYHGDPRIVREHCILGAEIIRKFPEGEFLSEVLKYHHDVPNYQVFALREEGADIPFMSKIISLADKLDLHIGRQRRNQVEREEILNWVKNNEGHLVYPEVVPAVLEAAYTESFWLDLERADLLDIAQELIFSRNEILDSESVEDDAFLVQIALTFANLIDQKSRFTLRHSTTVSDTAVRLAKGLGWGIDQLREMRIAGLLHDLGKLAVPNKILDKPGKLDSEEFAIIKTHTYYTYHLLVKAGFPIQMACWAAFHHERLDAKGYPFGIKANRLDEGARIMTIADIYTALTEERPYRKGLSHGRALEIISGGIGTQVDGKLVEVARRALG